MEKFNRREFIKSLTAASAALAALPGAATAKDEKDWKVYMFNATHADIGWHDFPHIIREKITGFLDIVIELCDKTKNSDIPYVYTVEHAWIVENYEKTRSRAQFKKLVNCIKRGQIDVGAIYASVHTDLCGHEELARSLLYAAGLRRRYGLTVDCALLNDVSEGYSKGLAQILAKNGIQGVVFGPGVKAASQGIAPTLPRLFYWRADDGSQVMVAWTPGFWTYLKGSVAGFRGMKTLTEFAQLQDYPYDAMFRFAGGGDIAPPDPALIDEVRQFRKECKTEKIKLATASEFFTYMKQKYADQMPVLQGDNPHSWADGTISLAHETGLHKRNQHDIITAEMMAALFMKKNYPAEQISRVYNNLLLYSDHTWGFDFDPDGRPGEMKKVKRAVNQGQDIVITIPEGELFTAESKFFDDYRKHWQEKKDYVYQARKDIAAVQDQAFSALCSQVETADPGIVVFNPLSFVRTDVVVLPLEADKCSVQIQDRRTGKTVPCQIDSEAGAPRTLIFIAEQVPATGYTVFDMVEKKEEDAVPVVGQSDTIENRFYRVKIDGKTGSVISIFDKELHKELIDQAADYGFNQYIHCNVNPFYNGSGGPEKAGIVYGEGERYVPDQVGGVESKEGSVFSTLSVAAQLSQGPAPAQVTRVIRLYHDVKRIDIFNRVNKKESLFKEQIYFAFPFAVACRPDLLIEQPYAFLHWDKDILPGCWRGYCSVQNFVQLSDAELAVTWCSPEAPVASFGGINSNRWDPEWHKNFRPDNGHIYSYIMSNMWNCNYALFQGGETVLPYSFTSAAKPDSTRSARFGWSVAHPLQAKRIMPKSGGRMAAGYSAVSVDVDNVLITAVKRAEDGRGIVVRLFETGQQPETKLKLSVHFSPVQSAWLTLLSEEDVCDLAVSGNSIQCTIKTCEVISLRIIV
jgi:hypothetical protein